MKKILLSLLVLVAGATGFAAVHYVLWMNASIARLEAGSQVVMTPRGHVEYAISGTEGPVILFLHGTPGGYDQGAHFALVAAKEGFRFVRPSRPGYLRTPLEVGRTPAEQADATSHFSTRSGCPALPSLDYPAVDRPLSSLLCGTPIDVSRWCRFPEEAEPDHRVSAQRRSASWAGSRRRTWPVG